MCKTFSMCLQLAACICQDATVAALCWAEPRFPASPAVLSCCQGQKDLVSSRAVSPLLPKPRRTSTGSQRRKIPQQDAIGRHLTQEEDGEQVSTGTEGGSVRHADAWACHVVMEWRVKGRQGDKEGSQIESLMFVSQTSTTVWSR